jgi:hypothetical protein
MDQDISLAPKEIYHDNNRVCEHERKRPKGHMARPRMDLEPPRPRVVEDILPEKRICQIWKNSNRRKSRFLRFQVSTLGISDWHLQLPLLLLLLLSMRQRKRKRAIPLYLVPLHLPLRILVYPLEDLFRA